MFPNDTTPQTDVLDVLLRPIPIPAGGLTAYVMLIIMFIALGAIYGHLRDISERIEQGGPILRNLFGEDMALRQSAGARIHVAIEGAAAAGAALRWGQFIRAALWGVLAAGGPVLGNLAWLRWPERSPIWTLGAEHTLVAAGSVYIPITLLLLAAVWRPSLLVSAR